jgi:hypothetical protein
MPQTISEMMVDGVLGTAEGMPLHADVPWYMDMMESVPTLTASAGTKAFRGTGTILRAGWRDSAPHLAPRGGIIREGLSQANYANPRNWGRFAEQSYFHQTGPQLPRGMRARDATGAHYTPFYGAAAINAIGRGLGGQAPGRVGQALGRSPLGQAAQRGGFVGEGRELVSRGFYSRLGAAGRVGLMSDNQFGRHARNVHTFLEGARHAAGQAGPVRPMGRIESMQAIAFSDAGTLSGRAGGFLHGAGRPISAQAYREATGPAQAGIRAAQRMGTDIGLRPGVQYRAGEMIRAGVQTGRAAGGMAGVKAAGKGVGLAAARVGGLAIPGVNIAMAAWLAYDLAKLGAKGLGHTARLGIEAHRSFMGGTRTGIMEQGFTDTEATMTSRARGVQAISNSRLNARSILGSEASAMHAHFSG